MRTPLLRPARGPRRAVSALAVAAVALAGCSVGAGSSRTGGPPLGAAPSPASVTSPADAATGAGSVVGPVVVPVVVPVVGPAAGTATGHEPAPPRPPMATAPHRDVPPAGPSAAPAEPSPSKVSDIVTGTVVRAYADIGQVSEDAHEHPGVAAAMRGDEPGLITWIQTDDGLSVRVPTGQLREVPDGARVRADLGGRRGADGHDPRGHQEIGYEVLAADVVAPPATAPQPDAAGTMAASTPHQVMVVMVAPAGQNPDGTTLSSVVSTVEGPVSAFWSQQTGGAVSFDVVRSRDWIRTASTCGESAALWNEAASAVGWTSGAGKHLLVYVSDAGSPASCYAGLGTVGSGPASGGKAYVSITSTSIIAHELGHNMGLGHSSGLLCAGTSDGVYGSGRWSNDCRTDSYRDWYDVMGISWSRLGSLNAPHSAALGALAGAGQADVTAPVRAVLAPMSGPSGLRALRLVDGSTSYWVEFRPPSGRDSWLASTDQRLAPGVIVRRDNPTDSRGSLLLDGTPSSSVDTGDWNAPIPVGAAMSLAAGRFVVKVEATSSGSAQVAISVDGVAPSAEDPVQVLSPAEGSLVPAGDVTVSGRGTAPEGTLQYAVTTPSGDVVQRGFADAGANGTTGWFSFQVRLGLGSYTVSVWLSDDSDGEGADGPRPHEVRRTFSVV